MTHATSPALRARRKGFSLIELAIVVSIMGIIVAIGAPKLRSVRDRSNLRAARDQIAAALATARAAAVQKGTTARFRSYGNTVDVLIPSTGQVILMPRDLHDLYNATVSLGVAGDAQINYDTRGFATVSNGTSAVYSVTVNGITDKVCVSKLGIVKKQGCVQ